MTFNTSSWRGRALAPRYGFLTFWQPDQGRPAWLSGIIDRVGRCRAIGSGPLDSRWSRSRSPGRDSARGVDATDLSTFPEEFRQGMAARAAILGETGATHPDRRVGGLATPDLHAIVILFARDGGGAGALRSRAPAVRGTVYGYCALGSRCGFRAVEAFSTLDLKATPPLDTTA